MPPTAEADGGGSDRYGQLRAGRISARNDSSREAHHGAFCWIGRADCGLRHLIARSSKSAKRASSGSNWQDNQFFNGHGILNSRLRSPQGPANVFSPLLPRRRTTDLRYLASSVVCYLSATCAQPGNGEDCSPAICGCSTAQPNSDGPQNLLYRALRQPCGFTLEKEEAK
jgi:hypothetical protein